ncbi:MAG: hypothetical protein FDZ75_07695 [Actinobacteria bacterium]|nr:MAG: hypothetical protein FDZ75_07695 [Actinomycetota bacterium]
MGTLAEAARLALEPFVGAMVADTCVRATALSLGKTSDDLIPDDLPSLENRIRSLLGPVAPTATIDQVVGGLRRTVQAGV